MREVGGAILVAAAALGFTSARAANPAPSFAPQASQPMFEVTPFPGFSLGGNFTLTSTGQNVDVHDHGSFALALDLLAADNSAQSELFYSHQSTALHGNLTPAPMGISVEYLHIGGTVPIEEDSPGLSPYFLAGLGVTRFSPPAPGRVDTRFSAQLGFGLRVPVTARLSLRLEGRGFLTLVSSDTSLFCGSNQTGLVCEIHGHGSTLLQGQALAGVAFAF